MPRGKKKSTPHCLAAIFDSQLPSPELPLKMPPKLPLPHRKRPVCSQNFCSQFAPLNHPPPNQQNDGFPLEFLLKGPQTELRTLSQNCEQTLQKLRTNRIMNKRAFLTTQEEGNFSSFKIAPAVRVTARQLSGTNCLAALRCLPGLSGLGVARFESPDSVNRRQFFDSGRTDFF